MSTIEDMQGVDQLQVVCGLPKEICPGLTVRSPLVGDIVKLGEQRYASMVEALTATPSDLIAQLDKMGIDWETIEDFELFCLLCRGLPLEETSVLFGDVDFRLFEIVPFPGERRCVLKHMGKDIVLDELGYQRMIAYLCALHGIRRKRRRAGNAMTKKIMIEMAYEDLEAAARKPKESALLPLLSTLTNMAGFKYNWQEVMAIPYAQLIDAAGRVQIIQSSLALLNGCYSGNIDTSKVDKNELNYMRAKL